MDSWPEPVLPFAAGWPNQASAKEGLLPRLVVAALLLAASGASDKAAAQDIPKPSDGEQIVVTANRDVKREIRDFVGALTSAPVRGQLSRFEWKVCPGVLGVAPSQKEKLVTRMRRVAKAATIPLAREACTPNVLLVVTEDKKKFIEALNSRYPEFLGGMTRGQLRRLLQAPGPAAAWQVDGPPLNADGKPLGVARAMIEKQQPDADGSFYMNDTSRSGSRVGPGARRHFQAAVVVVESKALDGLTTTQLADYAAMRAFARMDPADLPAGGQPTILKVLEAPMGSPVPVTLTALDLGFLRGLYGTNGNLYAGAQRSDIRKAIEAELRRSEEDPE